MEKMQISLLRRLLSFSSFNAFFDAFSTPLRSRACICNMNGRRDEGMDGGVDRGGHWTRLNGGCSSVRPSGRGPTIALAEWRQKAGMNEAKSVAGKIRLLLHVYPTSCCC